MEDTTSSPSVGGAVSAIADDLKIISVELEPRFREPWIIFNWRGYKRHGLDHICYKWCKDGKFGLTMAQADAFKQAGIDFRSSNGLEPWPYASKDAHQAPTMPLPRGYKPRSNILPDAMTKATDGQKKALPRHTFAVIEGPYRDPDTNHTMIRFEHDGKEEVLTLEQLYDDVRTNFPDQFPPQAEGEIEDLWLGALQARGHRKEEERGIAWPVGGILPIKSDTFTEEKALESGIIYEDGKGAQRVNIHSAATYIMDHISFARISFDKGSKYVELRYYDKGRYYDQGRPVIEMAAEKLLGSFSSNQRVAEVVGKISRTFEPKEPDDDNIEGWISVKNCYLNIYTREVELHNPGRVFTIQLPVEYNKDATSEAFKKFLWEIQTPLPFHPTYIASDDMLALEEMMGYCLMPGYPYQWLFILLGEGQNGKSVLLNVISALLGEENTQAVPLQELDSGKDRFAAADLRGALANLCGDLSANELKSTGTIKKATGRDYIRAQQKGQPAFKYKNRAKMIFACNELPYSPDDTRGFVRRPRLFTFDQQFTSTTRVKADPDMLSRLTTPKELSGILNIALDGLDRLRKNGALTGREDEEFEIERFRNMQDTPGRFIEQHVVVDQAFAVDGVMCRAHKTGKKELYDAYCTWCEAKGYLVKRDREFNKRLKELFNEVIREGRWEDQNPEEAAGRVWIGIRFEPP